MEAGKTFEIDADELREARGDRRVASLLGASAAEGARVQREGRERWGSSDGAITAEALAGARDDERVVGFLKGAAAEGARVDRAGRQGW